MNNIINKFLLAADKVMPGTYLKDLKVGTYSACGPVTRHKDRIDKFFQTGDTNYIHKNEQEKACFAHDAAYSGFKDIKNKTAGDKILRDKAYKIGKKPKYYGSQRGLTSMIYKFFDRKTAGSGVKSIPQNEQLADELHKPIIGKFKKRKVYSAFKDNICAAYSADMQLISKFTKGFIFLLCVIDIYSFGCSFKR